MASRTGLQPNVAAISYLNAACRLTSELKQRAEDNIAMGYQRELQYRHSTERSRRLEKVLLGRFALAHRVRGSQPQAAEVGNLATDPSVFLRG